MKERIYIGSYTNKISICELNNGKLKIINQVDVESNPSYLHINRDMLYAVCENRNGSIVSLRIQGKQLKIIDVIETKEILPCYIDTDEYRKLLYVSNYESGTVDIFKIKRNGKIINNMQKLKYDNANIHFTKFNGKELFVIDLGNDKVYIYDKKMELKEQLFFAKKSGPRHLVSTKDNNNIFVVTELSNEICHYKREKNGFRLIEKVSTIEKQNSKSYAGAIKISKNNKHIYVTNRGEDSISVYEIINKKLKLIQNISSYGKFPRDIFLNKNEKYVMVSNQKSNLVTIFRRNKKSGILTKLENMDVKIDKPSCIVRSRKWNTKLV